MFFYKLKLTFNFKKATDIHAHAGGICRRSRPVLRGWQLSGRRRAKFLGRLVYARTVSGKRRFQFRNLCLDSRCCAETARGAAG